jgi:hypothetical protein
MSTYNDRINPLSAINSRGNQSSRFGFGNIRNFLILIALTLCISTTYAQIYEPEGLNLPGLWNGWTNPPVNNLALASYTQVPGGRVTKINSTSIRWQTIFSVAASGADVVGGTYPWLFTSGPTGNPWANKWAGVTVVKNTLQSYTYNTGADNSITVSNGKWYTMNWNDIGYANSQAIFMETTNQPVVLNTVSVPANVYENTPVAINLTVSSSPSTEEIFYLRYTTNMWTTSSLLTFTMTGTNGTVNIPGQSAGTRIDYYAFSSTVSSITGNYDLFTIRTNNNAGANYHYNVGSTLFISFANLNNPESGNIQPGNAFEVSALVFAENVTNAVGQGAGIQAWIGYSTTNTNPSTWTNWVLASYNSDNTDNDEYIANIGSLINTEGTYYYASRFQYLSQAYVYGGYSATGGGFWNGTSNASGVLTVSIIPPPDPVIGYANIQWPGTGTIDLGTDFNVYAQAWIQDVTNQTGQTTGLQAWIGYSTTNSNPSTWTNWLPATFNTNVGNNDEFMSNLGASIISGGTYYYASRFQYLAQEYVYGGFSATGGGFWNGTTNVSGTLVINALTKSIDLTVFLEGAYNGGGVMRTTLFDNNLIPLDQPYNVAPWNYAGTESVVTVPAGVADWVLVDLRDAATPDVATTSISGWPKAYFLKSDGQIVDVDGTTLPNIGNPTITANLYVVVHHRNHIAVMSSAGMSLSGSTYSFDFSTSLDQAFGSGAGFKEIETGVFGMVAGDADGNGDIGVNDYTLWAIDFGNSPVYFNTDIDMDSDLGVNDYTKWAINFGISNPISSPWRISYKSQVPNRKQ